MNQSNKTMHIAFIGSAGIPNRYGGFESFLENCAPLLVDSETSVTVTCDAALYIDDLDADFKGVSRVFLRIRANGASSIIHDLVAFFKVFRRSTHIVVLGVSGGLWFPLFKLLCQFWRKRIGVNIDGVEWRRAKYSPLKQVILRIFDYLAQRFSHFVIYDNAGLRRYVINSAKERSFEIGYSGDHVLRVPMARKTWGSALTICRIEPENNIELLIKGALISNLKSYTMVGNWSNSSYGLRIRDQYKDEQRLQLLDPIYDPLHLANLRESCHIYLHGHSVGGTNPSLVEMLYYSSAIICFDVIYNRATALDNALYFSDSDTLSACINKSLFEHPTQTEESRAKLRLKYTKSFIAQSYLDAMTHV